MKQNHITVTVQVAVNNLLHDEAEFWYKELGIKRDQFYGEALLMLVQKCVAEYQERGYAMADYVSKKRAARGEIAEAGK